MSRQCFRKVRRDVLDVRVAHRERVERPLLVGDEPIETAGDVVHEFAQNASLPGGGQLGTLRATSQVLPLPERLMQLRFEERGFGQVSARAGVRCYLPIDRILTATANNHGEIVPSHGSLECPEDLQA